MNRKSLFIFKGLNGRLTKKKLFTTRKYIIFGYGFADVNGDGKLDFVSDFGGKHKKKSNVRTPCCDLYLNIGNFKFKRKELPTESPSMPTFPIDLDQDGRDELIRFVYDQRGSEDRVFVWRYRKAKFRRREAKLTRVSDYFRACIVTDTYDFDQDGDTDFICSDRGKSSITTKDTVIDDPHTNVFLFENISKRRGKNKKRSSKR